MRLKKVIIKKYMFQTNLSFIKFILKYKVVYVYSVLVCMSVLDAEP